MEYMKRSDRIYKEVALAGEKSDRYPSATSRQGIEFFDDIGMFRIIDGSKDIKQPPAQPGVFAYKKCRQSKQLSAKQINMIQKPCRK